MSVVVPNAVRKSVENMQLAADLRKECTCDRANELYEMALRFYRSPSTNYDDADQILTFAIEEHAESLGITTEQLIQDLKDKALHPIVRRIVELAQRDEGDAYDDGAH